MKKWSEERLEALRARLMAIVQGLCAEDVPGAAVFWCVNSLVFLGLAGWAWRRALRRAGAAPLRPLFVLASEVWATANDPELDVVPEDAPVPPEAS